MRTSDNIELIVTALASAQAEFESVKKSKTNPAFKSKYAELADIFDAVKPALTKYGLAIVQAPSFADGRITVTTRLFHKSGQWLETSLSLRPAADDAQKIGSAITYARRYSLSSLLGIAADEDDDGNAASFPTGGGFNLPRPASTPAPRTTPPTVEERLRQMVSAFGKNFEIPYQAILSYLHRDNELEVTAADLDKMRAVYDDLKSGKLPKEDFLAMAKGEAL